MKKNSKGFTLIELMIVVAIIGIMAMITAPNLVSGLPTYRIKAAVRDCTSQLRYARTLAIKDKRDVSSFLRSRQRLLCNRRSQISVHRIFFRQIRQRRGVRQRHCNNRC